MRTMIKFTCGIAVAIFAAAQVQAVPVLSDDFDAYSDGNLVGQGGWLQTGTIATTPIQVASGEAVLGTSGQDAYKAFGSAVTTGDGNTFYYGLCLSVVSASATGDYFIHVSNPAGTTSVFVNRLYARSSGLGFELGFAETSGGATIVYGGLLTLGTEYNVVVAEHFIAGALNNTFAVYVDPSDLSVELNNTAYLTKTYDSGTAETATYAAVNLRQGTAANAPGVEVDGIIVSTVFSDVSAVCIPEPSSMALAALGLVGVLAVRRRRS